MGEIEKAEVSIPQLRADALTSSIESQFGSGASHTAGGHQYPKTSRSEWIWLAILAISIVFGTAAIWKGKNLSKDIPMVAAFVTVFLLMALRPLRLRRYRKSKYLKVDVPGGVPIRGSRWPYIIASIWSLVLGAFCIWNGVGRDIGLVALGSTFSIFGCIIATAVYLGLQPLGHIQFEPDELIIADWRWRARVPWDQITLVREVEVNEFPYLLLYVDGAFDVEPKEYQSVRRRFNSPLYVHFCGAQFAISAVHIGIDLPLLTAAVVRYRADKAAREELKVRVLPHR